MSPSSAVQAALKRGYLTREIQPDGVFLYKMKIEARKPPPKRGERISIFACMGALCLLLTMPAAARADGSNGGAIDSTVSVTIVTWATNSNGIITTSEPNAWHDENGNF